ncbi:transglycosylase family protein [Streptomyces sp. NPDC002537]
MRSGNGRHRRPRQVPAVVVAVGVTGSALAMPLLAATGATAADAPTWDKVAQCESGGTWSTNSGNGAYGGLQLTQEMWEQHGGRAYAPRPDLASRAQQIAVAEQIVKAGGTDAFGGCGVAAGLAKDGRAPDVNPGSAKEPPQRTPATRAPEHTSPAPDSSTGSDSSSSAPSGAKPSSPPASPSAPPASPDAGKPSPSTGDKPENGRPEGGKHRKDPTGGPTGDPTQIPTAPVPSTDPPANRPTDSGSPQSPDGSKTDPNADPNAGAGTGGGKHRAEPPRSDGDGRASRGGSDSRTEKPAPGDYTVRPGDNLSDIAEAHSVKGGWHSLYQHNEKIVGTDPDLILPGQRLEVGK